MDRQEPQYSVVLPVAPDDFREFVSSLLGKPQTIEKTFGGIFELTKQDIENTFHLVDQRIHQQNKASLIQFTVNVHYDDHSTVLHNSLQDFLHYAEVRPLIAKRVILTWIYMIQFQDKQIPEKQQIEMLFGVEGPLWSVRTPLHDLRLGLSHIRIIINHTARTWGTDIEALLTGGIENLEKLESKFKKFIYEKSEWIGTAAGVMFFTLALIGSYLATNQFIVIQMKRAQSIVVAGNDLSSLADKINFLIESAANGLWPRFIVLLTGSLLLAIVVAIFLGIWVGMSADNRPNSFLLLTTLSEKDKDETLKKRKRRWLMFIVAGITSIISGVIANFLYTAFFPGIK